MKEINSPDEIPEFQNEDEEAEFWATHSLGPGMLRHMKPLHESDSPLAQFRTRPVAIRFDRDVIFRLKRVARIKGKGYQTLLKEFVAERLYEEEKREGLL